MRWRWPYFDLFILVVSCTSLDPDKYGSHGSQPGPPGAAGYYFDAGATGDSGGRGGASVNQAGSKGQSSAGRGSEPDSGAAGERGEGGAPDEGGAGGQAGFGGFAGARLGGGGGGGARGNGGAGAGRGGSGGMRAIAGGAGQNVAAGAGQAGAGHAGTGSVGSGGTSGGQGGLPAAHAFYFSEYVEGSSSYKALEITARDASSFAGCRLATYFNGAVTGTGIALEGTLAAGGTYVLCSSALATLVGAACTRTTNLTFNGDDAVALECDGVTLDVIGQIGVDPGDAWGSGDSSTLNHTLRRACSATAGDRDGSNPFDPLLEWLALPVDSFDGLGHAECGG